MSLLVMFTHTLSLSGLHTVTLAGWLLFTPPSCLYALFLPLSPFLFVSQLVQYIPLLFAVCQSSLSPSLNRFQSAFSLISASDGRWQPQTFFDLL